jgi:hypothetical protein
MLNTNPSDGGGGEGRGERGERGERGTKKGEGTKN